MGARLIDSDKAFRQVYALFNHEYLGMMMSAHVVQELDNGRLSLSYQGLNPDNFEQFAFAMDQTDEKIVEILSRINPNELQKKFAPKAKNQMDFYLKWFQGAIKSAIDSFISRTLREVILLLPGREVYIMGKDGYPAQYAIDVIPEKAEVVFHFLRDKKYLRYYPVVTLGRRKVNLKHHGTEIILNEPAWLLHHDCLFTFRKPVEGKKLQPFLKKDFISIERKIEATYFRKFVPQIIERYRVEATGIDIVMVEEEPEFSLWVDVSDKNAVSMELKVVYGDFSLKPDPDKKYTAIADREEEADTVRFFKVKRARKAEEVIVKLLKGMTPADNLMGFEFMSRPDGLKWLSTNVETLRAHGVKLRQKGVDKLNFDRPEVEIETTESGDWFDIRAVVKIGSFSIPFMKFKNHILKGIRDFTLPDGSMVILPESWFSDYRHLVEIAEEQDDETLRLKKYQAVVLDMKVAGAGLKDKFGALAGIEEIPDSPVPEALQAELRSYQKSGYDWLGFLREKSFGGILADDMGLGKTLQTLALLLQEKEKGVKQPSLIVMPTSLIYNWQAEVRKFVPDLKVLVQTGSGRTKNPDNFAIYDVILTTYGLVRQDIRFLKKFPFHYAILDESQMIKNPSSKTAKAVRELKAAHRLALTGTPLENSLTDLWSQMAFVNPGLLGGQRFFKAQYVQPIEKLQDEKKQAQLKKIIHPFIMRRTKEQVAHELPPKVEHRHFCEMTEPQRELYDETKNAYRNYLLGLEAGEFNKKKLNILAGLQKLRQIAIHPGLVEEGEGMGLEDSGKYIEFKRLLGEVLAKNSKVLVFSQFVRLLKVLEADLKKDGVTMAYLDGKTKDRQGEVYRFQENPNVKVFLISLKAGGVGLNLTAAEYVFILDPWWNPAVEAQAIDRSHRIGQKNTVFSYKFITRNSIEEKIVKLQERKAKLSDDIVSVEKNIFKKLNQEDLEELLS